MIFLLAAAFFVSVSVNYVIAPVLPAIARGFDMEIGEAGSLVAVYSLFYACFALILGPVSDYFGRKLMIVAALLGFSLMTLLCGIVQSYPGLLLFRALAGIAAATMQPATWSYLGDYFAYERRGTAAAWVMQAGSLALVVGVPIGSLSAQLLGWRWVFVLAALLGLAVAALVTLSLPALSSQHKTSHPGIMYLFRFVRLSFSSLIRQRQARFVLSVSFLTWFAFFALYTYIGAYFMERFRLTTAETGFMTLAVGIGYILGGQAGGRLSDRIGRRAVIRFGLGALGGVLFCVPTIRSLPLSVISMLAMGFTFFFTYTAQVTLVTELLPEGRSTMMSANYFCTYIGVTAGSASGGFLIAHLGFGAVGIMSALACLSAVLVSSRYVLAAQRSVDPAARPQT